MSKERGRISFTTDDFNSLHAVHEAEVFAGLVGPIHGSVIMTDVARFQPVRQFASECASRLTQFELGPHIDVTEGVNVKYPWLVGRRGITRTFLYGVEAVSRRSPRVGKVLNRGASRVLRLFSELYQEEIAMQVELAFDLFNRRDDMMVTYHDGLHNLSEPYVNYHIVAHKYNLPHRGARKYNGRHTWDGQLGFYDSLNVDNMNVGHVMSFVREMHELKIPTEVDLHLGQKRFCQIQTFSSPRVAHMIRENFTIMQPGKLSKLLSMSA